MRTHWHHMAMPPWRLVLAALVITFFVAGCGGTNAVTDVSTLTPVATSSPAPAWLVKAAERQAAAWGDPHPTAAYWGLLRDPELGALTGSGPDDPSHKAYVIVLVGDYSGLRKAPPAVAGVSPSPPPPVKWGYWTYTLSHQAGGSFGSGFKEFVPSQYPSLRPMAVW